MLVLTVKKMDDGRILTQQFLTWVIQCGVFDNLATEGEEDVTHDEEGDEEGQATLEDFEKEEDSLDDDGPPSEGNAEEKENIDYDKSITEEEQKEPPKDADDDVEPDSYDITMEHANGESDDEVFTATKTSTENDFSVQSKVAAMESKPASGE